MDQQWQATHSVIRGRDFRRDVLVGSDKFITALPGSVLRLYRTRHSLRELAIELRVRPPLAIVTLKNRTLGPTVQSFIQCAREVAGPLAR